MLKRFKPGKKKCEICPNEFDKDPRQPFKTWCSPECAVAIARRRQTLKEKKNMGSSKKENANCIKNLNRL